MDRKFEYVMRLADSPLILGQRLGEWCGHGPILEQDIALSNISLDQIGLARYLFQYAAELKGDGSSEDDLALVRKENEYRNFLLCEITNGDWAKTLLRQFFFDAFQYNYLQDLKNSSDERLAAIAKKSFKEVAYHIKYSSEWVIRMGDGTRESHQRIVNALEELWPFTGELLQADDLDLEMEKLGIGPNIESVAERWKKRVQDIFEEATLIIPEDSWMQKGGKSGVHTEHMGFILSELQYMQRAYPNLNW